MNTYVIQFMGEVEVEAKSKHEALCSNKIPIDADKWYIIGCYDEYGEEVDPLTQMDLINRTELLKFPYLPEAGTDEVIMDLAWENLPHDIVIENENDILEYGWSIIKAMLNIIKTAEKVGGNKDDSQ